MKSMKAILSVALVLAASSISVASTPVCNHRVASSGNDLFKNTNPPAKKLVAASTTTSRPQPARTHSTSGVQ
jgi:hypothetical protein